MTCPLPSPLEWLTVSLGNWGVASPVAMVTTSRPRGGQTNAATDRERERKRERERERKREREREMIK